MNRRFVIMTGNLGQGFGAEFAKKYQDALSDAFRCEVADGHMQPIKVVVQEGSGAAPRGGWEQDEDEDVIRAVADEVYNRLVYEENYEEPYDEWLMEDLCADPDRDAMNDRLDSQEEGEKDSEFDNPDAWEA